ncbi:glycosyltransferase [Microbacterium sp. NPDC055357]
MTDAVSFVVPRGLDDPARVSGGNVYDRQVRDGLLRTGWLVRTVEVDPAQARGALEAEPDGALVLVDGLVAGASAAAIEDASARLRIVVLAHMVSSAFPQPDPAAAEGERRAVRAARAVIATSEWTAAQLDRDDVAVAAPGVAPATVASGTQDGGALLCVGVLAPHKGQDVLVTALAELTGIPDWHCTLAGATDADPAFVDDLRDRLQDAGLRERVELAGVCTADELDRRYDGTDLLVAPTRVEAYGMVVAEAQARGIPVLASGVGGVPEAVADDAALLVPPGDAGALADALRQWMTDPDLRGRLTTAARRARPLRRGWDTTVARVSDALAGVP